MGRIWQVCANLGDATAFFGCTFSNNTASQGGGAILVTNVTSAQMSNCSFLSNKAQKGGGILINECNGDVLDSNFTTNQVCLLKHIQNDLLIALEA